MEIFAQYGLPVSGFDVATSPADARAAAERRGGSVVVKAQVHVGGRGKAGGVKLARDADEAERYAESILGMDIKGLTVEKIVVAETVDIDREYYIGIVVDRATKKPVYMVSSEGGVDIEEVARETPEKRGGRRTRREDRVRSSRSSAGGRRHSQALRGLRRERCVTGGDQPPRRYC
jgi:succinyl-CoA synthetase beta subunit